jgi:allene oxide cyclase
MRRRWKRRLLWAAVLSGVLLLAIPATVAQVARSIATFIERRPPMRILVPLAAVLALAAAAGWSTLASASSAQSTDMTLLAVDVAKSEIYVDAGAKGDGPGDTIFFRETLLKSGKAAGGSDVMCIFVRRNAGRCSGTLRLSGGTLEASGGTRFGGRFSLPIVGGTGRYSGASGELTVVAVNEKRSRYLVELVG